MIVAGHGFTPAEASYEQHRRATWIQVLERVEGQATKAWLNSCTVMAMITDNMVNTARRRKLEGSLSSRWYEPRNMDYAVTLLVAAPAIPMLANSPHMVQLW